MASKQQQSGMRGVYLVAAELVARGFIVSVTSRGAAGADLLVMDERCAQAWSVQVKATIQPAVRSHGNYWLLNREAKIPVCCRYHPNRDFHGPASPDPLESAVLQHP